MKQWTTEEKELLKKIYRTNSKKFILSQLDYPWRRICRKARKLNLHRDTDLINEDRKIKGTRKDSYSSEENTLLIEIYENNTKEYILSKFNQSNFNRSWQSIRNNAQKLGLIRNSEIIKQEMIKGGKNAPEREDFWSEEEKNLLKEIYENNSKEFILSKFNNRTWKATRRVAVDLGLSRNPDLIKLETATNYKKTVKKKYGVDHIFHLEATKVKFRQTNLKRRGVEYPTQCPIVQEKAKKTVKEKYGVENAFQSEEIKKKIIETNLKKYGVESPLQNPEIRKKVIETTVANNSFACSDEETHFYNYLKIIDPSVEHQIIHPVTKDLIDFYMPRYNLWVQYDGSYWHGKELKSNDNSPRAEKIKERQQFDKIQNKNIPNLVRFWSDDVKKAVKEDTILPFIKEKISQITPTFSCYQYRKKIQWLNEDIQNFNFEYTGLKASSFELALEKFNHEITQFIKKYEWLGTVGTNPKWCFTARYKNYLGGIVLINEPGNYSKILGKNTMTYEALIQRGATASWTPKNLGSRLIRFACSWMINNTSKRAFIGYADPKALEIGTIYQACNFEYLGGNFGSSYLYRHPSIKNYITFSAQSLKRTSAFKRWCKIQKISPPQLWFKENGFKNLATIPNDIKLQWYNWNNKILSESQKILTNKKHKYILVLGKNKREKRHLDSLKNYTPKPYPKRDNLLFSDSIKDPNIKITLDNLKITSLNPISYSIKCRRTPEKMQYIINNYHKKTKLELASDLKETKRWISSQVKFLQKEGQLATKNPTGCTKSRKTKEKIQYIINNYGKIKRKEIAENLNESIRWVKRQIYLLKKDNLLTQY